jgi:hypothetical protein
MFTKRKRARAGPTAAEGEAAQGEAAAGGAGKAAREAAREAASDAASDADADADQPFVDLSAVRAELRLKLRGAGVSASGELVGLGGGAAGSRRAAGVAAESERRAADLSSTDNNPLLDEFIRSRLSGKGEGSGKGSAASSAAGPAPVRSALDTSHTDELYQLPEELRSKRVRPSADAEQWDDGGALPGGENGIQEVSTNSAARIELIARAQAMRRQRERR